MSETFDARRPRRQPGSDAPSSQSGRAPEPPVACPRFADLVAPYALGVPDRGEAATVERHRAACPACAAELASLRRAAALLPYLAPPARPSADVKAALFARIAQASQVDQAGPVVAPVEAASVSTTVPTPTLPASRPTPPSRPRRESPTVGRGPFRLPALPALPVAGRFGWGGEGPLPGDRRRPGYALSLASTAIPLVLALAVVGGYAVSMRDRVAQQSAEVQNLEARLSAMGGFVGDDDNDVYELTAGPAGQGADGLIYANPEDSEALLMVERLHGGAGATYRIFVERDGRLVPVDAELEVDEDGYGQVLFDLPQPFANYRSVHVMAEPLSATGTAAADDQALSAMIVAPAGPANARDSTLGEQDLGVSARRYGAAYPTVAP